MDDEEFAKLIERSTASHRCEKCVKQATVHIAERGGRIVHLCEECSRVERVPYERKRAEINAAASSKALRVAWEAAHRSRACDRCGSREASVRSTERYR